MKIYFLLILILLAGCQVHDDSLKIGAILPLSGPPAFWGESIKNGMDLNDANIIYEDSQGNPSKGISAFNKLVSVDKVDVIVSAFSRVSIPLIKLAEEEKIPLIMTLVLADGVTGNYSFRYYTQPKQHIDLFFEFVNHSRIALLTINDELGESMSKEIRKKTEVIIEERFEPRATDFRTQLSKIKAMNPDAIMITTVLPNEFLNAVEQIKQLDIEADIFDIVHHLTLEPRKDVDGIYTAFLPFVDNPEFKSAYKNKYNSDPIYSAVYGYDIVRLIVSSFQEGKVVIDKKEWSSLYGNITINSGEINPPLIPAIVKNGSLKLI